MSDTEDKRLFIANLYIESYGKLLKFAIANLREKHLAEDMVQETFLCAENKIDDVMKSKNPAGWLMKTMKNTILHVVRAAAIRQEKLHLLAHIEPVSGLCSNPEVLYSGIVSDLDLQILIKAHVEGRSYSEISNELGLSIDGVNKRSQRAKQRIREELEKII